MDHHNPVPFHFVPFSSETPLIRTPDDWEKLGDLLTGCIKFSIEALTGVHIVGKQTRKRVEGNIGIGESSFYRSANEPVIPGSSLKGMFRSFLEAFTNSWVSQATEEHPRVRGRRRVPFFAYGSRKEKSKAWERIASHKP